MTMSNDRTRGTLDNATVLLVGAGEMAELAARHLKLHWLDFERFQNTRSRRG